MPPVIPPKPSQSVAPEHASSVTIIEGEWVRVRDLDTAVYFKMRAATEPQLGLRIVDCVRVHDTQHIFTFHDPRGVARDLEVEFANSPFVHYAGHQRDLKRLMRRAKHAGHSSGHNG